MQFGVLGPLAVWTPEGDHVKVPERKVRALLADLLIQRGQPISADRLIDDLWGADAPDRKPNTLQTRVSQLRRLLETVEPGGRGRLELGPAGYRLRIDDGALDADRFTALVTRARAAREPEQRSALYEEALAVWRGPALADLADESFATATVARLEEERLSAIEESTETRLALGGHASLVAELGALVDAHPLRERLRAASMLALYRSGRQSEALDSFQRLRSRLGEELGLDPGTEIAALHEAILRQDPVLDAVSDPTATAGRGAARHVPAPSNSEPSIALRTNLPVSTTALIGRDEAVSAVCAAIGTDRIVTLTGPGGVGKTRLALAAAHHLIKTQALRARSEDARVDDPGVQNVRVDDVRLVELAGLAPRAEPAGCVGEVVDLFATALDIGDTTLAGPAVGPRIRTDPDGAGLARLIEATADRAMVLVLDNCEHVIEAVAEVVEQLLAAAPGLRILATSREPLGVSGEVAWPVRPLDLPSPVATDPGTVAAYSSARLFIARAEAASPGFTITPANALAIATICRRLDGIPLALELAASRVRAIGVEELAQRLDDRFGLLAAGKRGVPARQRTLRAMIDWSWQLLSDAERTVLRRLAVHAGGCTLDAAEAVCAVEDVPALLARLVDRSLVVADRGSDSAGPCATPSPVRYRLLESVAAYCLERLDEAGETGPVRQRHRRVYTEFAERAARHLTGPDQCLWLRGLDAERANLRAALDDAVADRDADGALRLVNALAWHWYLRGRRSEATRSLERALTVSGSAAADLVAVATTWRAALSIQLDAQRTESIDAVLQRYEALDHPAGAARAQWLLGWSEFGFGDLARSEELAEDALVGFRTVDDQWGIAAALGLKADQAIFRSDFAAVRRFAEASLELFERLGDGWGRLRALSTLGTHAEITGDYERADRCYADGLPIAEQLELHGEVCSLLSLQGRIAILTGDYERADRLHERAARLAAEHANTAGEEFAAIGLAISARRQGDLETAESHLRRWLGWNRQVEADYGTALILAELGFVAEQRGDAVDAADLHTEALAAALRTGDPRAIALTVEGLAGAEAAAGLPTRAARLLGVAAATRAAVGAPLPPGERFDVDRIGASLREALGEDEFTAAFDQGAATSAS